MKTHLSFSTTDLARSVTFYATLFDRDPIKQFGDYALFILDDPSLELALRTAHSVGVAGDTHFGVCVDSLAEVERTIERLDRAGLVSSVEREQTCCYANQSKVWATDPHGRRWEVYTVHDETPERNGAPAAGCASAACCAP